MAWEYQGNHFTQRNQDNKNTLLNVLVWRRNLFGAVANVLDWHVFVREFDLQLHYYINFRIRILNKGMNLVILQLCII